MSDIFNFSHFLVNVENHAVIQYFPHATWLFLDTP